TGLGVNVGGAGVKISRAHGVTDGLALLAEGDAILVVVVPLLDQAAHVQELDGQVEVLLVAGFARELDQRHQMGRKNSMPWHLGRGFVESFGEKIRGASAAAK